MINLEKANCSAPPGRNMAIFKFRDDTHSQIKHSALCKRKQETINTPAPCVLAASSPLLPGGTGAPRDPSVPCDTRPRRKARLGAEQPVPHPVLNAKSVPESLGDVVKPTDPNSPTQHPSPPEQAIMGWSSNHPPEEMSKGLDLLPPVGLWE